MNTVTKTVCTMLGLCLLLAAQAPPPPAPVRQSPAPQGQPGSGGPPQDRNRSRGGATIQREPVRPEDLASIEGQIVNGITGEPLNKATVMVRPTEGPPDQGRFGPPGGFPGARSYTARTDTSGRFTISGVEPGKYRISVTRNGFVDQDYGSTDYLRYGSPVTIAAKQQMRDLTVKMTPNAVITGRVVDEDGEAMAGVQVEALRNRYSQGKRVLSVYKSANTNDLGEYRIYGLPPGRYFIAAAGRRGPRSSPESQDEYVTTFFAGTTDPASATYMEVGPAQQASADLRLRKQATVSVKGRVIDNAAGEGRRAGVFLTPRSMTFSSNSMRPAMVEANGNFEIRGVAPGAYLLVATSSQRGRPSIARMPVDVGNRGVDALTIQIQPAMQLTGRVRLEAKDPVNAGSIQLRLALRDPVGMMGPSVISAPVKADGTFAFTGVTADQYTVSVSALPDGYYVKHARLGDQDALALGVDTRSGAAMPLDILLSPNAGKASGTVMNDQQQIIANATVVLVPAETERREQPQFYKTATSGADGRFTIGNIEPGQYRVFAWRDVETGAYMDADFLRPVEGRGETVNIKESSAEEVRVRVIP
ncbi:MAG: carboxypeptidase regulatory-like domain-containing protein [Bryobacterales bacterium]|nr:carboxypeptidase regulatory-like domain-containing protein [Bryobacterales bacterium]